MSLSDLDDYIGPKLKKPSFALLGAYNMFDNKFDEDSTKVCPEIEKNTNVNLFSYFRTFSNILLKAPLSDLSWKTEICRSKEIRGGDLASTVFPRIIFKLQ